MNSPGHQPRQASTTRHITAMPIVGSASRRAALPNPAVRRVISAAMGAGLGVGVGLILSWPAPVSAAPAATAVTLAVAVDDGDRGGVEVDGEAGTIRGVVVGRDGRRHLGVIVKLHEAGAGDEPGAFLQPAYTGVDGRYRFDGLGPGCYQVVVDAPAGTAFPATADGDDGDGDGDGDGGPVGLDHLVTCVDGATIPAELRSVTKPETAEDPVGSTDTRASTVEPMRTRTIEVVHLGHHLGQLEPMTIDLELEGATVETEVGGWPRVVAAIDAVRPVDAPESTITVHTGGVLAGSALSHLFGGAADAALLDRVCFDYLAPSPHDQARADEWTVFRRFIDSARCATTVLDPDGPVRADSASPDPAVAIHAVGDGAVGLVSIEVGSAGEVDPVAATTDRVEELVDNGVTTIVVLSGLGLRADRELARQIPEIDAIVGSGAGSMLGAIDDLGLTTGGPYPDRERNADGDEVCLGHAGDRGQAIGVLRIEVDGDGRVIDCGGAIQLLIGRHTVVANQTNQTNEMNEANQTNEANPGTGEATESASTTVEPPSDAAIDRAMTAHPALHRIAPDLETSRALDRWTRVRDLLLDDPVAQVTDGLCRTAVPGRTVGLLCGPDGQLRDTSAPRSDVQRLVADALRHRAAQLGHPAIALIDSQTVGEAVSPGSLSAVDAYGLLPTAATLAVVEIGGAELATILQQRIDAAVDDQPGAYPHTSGLRFTPDLTRSGRPRIGPIEVVDQNDRWQPLDPEAIYRVVVTNRLLADETGSPTLAAIGPDRVVATTVGTAEALLDYIDDVLGGIVEPPGTPPGGLDPTTGARVEPDVPDPDPGTGTGGASTPSARPAPTGSDTDPTDSIDPTTGEANEPGSGDPDGGPVTDQAADAGTDDPGTDADPETPTLGDPAADGTPSTPGTNVDDPVDVDASGQTVTDRPTDPPSDPSSGDTADDGPTDQG